MVDLADFSLPLGVEVPWVLRDAGGRPYRSAVWGPQQIQALTAELARGQAELQGIPAADLLAAWTDTVALWLNPDSLPRQALAAPLIHGSRLSPAGLAAGLTLVLGGVRGELAAELLTATRASGFEPGFVGVILAANLPALAVQPLLATLVRRRPLWLKSPSAEPLFTPAFVDSLCAREPRLRRALAVLTWPGGTSELEAPLWQASHQVLAYGTDETLRQLAPQLGAKLIAHGPKLSLAVLSEDVEPRQVAAGLAHDIALFDQRGCLSVQAIYTAGDPLALAENLAAELALAAVRWPPGPRDPQTVIAVQQVRADAELRGLLQPALPLPSGTVIVEPRLALQPSPGLRTVRVHALADLAQLPDLLAGWHGQLQGVALAGEDAWALTARLRALGASWLAAPGELQSVTASWHDSRVA